MPVDAVCGTQSFCFCGQEVKQKYFRSSCAKQDKWLKFGSIAGVNLNIHRHNFYITKLIYNELVFIKDAAKLILSILLDKIFMTSHSLVER